MLTEDAQALNALIFSSIFIITLTVFIMISIYRSQQKVIKLRDELLKSEIKILERERKNIGENLHDDLGPMLSYAKMMLNHIQPKSEEEIQSIKKAEETLVQCISSVRQISYQLVPPSLENSDFNMSIQNFLEKITSAASIRYSFSSNYESRTLTPDFEVNVFRIIQELVNNSIKHAQCSIISLDLMKKNKNLYLNYTDNGRGLDESNQTGGKKGLGFSNIKSRTQVMGGKLSIRTENNNGFICNIVIPIDSTND
jgi:signal transduction histidine kinase